jgi:hypothetical protein
MGTMESALKTCLASIALVMGMAFYSQAFAAADCAHHQPHKYGHYVCGDVSNAE